MHEFQNDNKFIMISKWGEEGNIDSFGNANREEGFGNVDEKKKENLLRKRYQFVWIL